MQKPWIVMVIFGGSAVASGILNLFLPETLGKHLPETLAQARNLGLENPREPSQSSRVASALVDDEGGENQPLLRTVWSFIKKLDKQIKNFAMTSKTWQEHLKLDSDIQNYYIKNLQW